MSVNAEFECISINDVVRKIEHSKFLWSYRGYCALPPLPPDYSKDSHAKHGDIEHFDCPICFESQDVEWSSLLHCGHRFCRDCFSQVCQLKNCSFGSELNKQGHCEVQVDCPTCRSPCNIWIVQTGEGVDVTHVSRCDLLTFTHELKYECFAAIHANVEGYDWWPTEMDLQTFLPPASVIAKLDVDIHYKKEATTKAESASTGPQMLNSDSGSVDDPDGLFGDEHSVEDEGRA